MLLLETFAVGPLQCNCSILACPDTKEAIVVDPGGDHDRILEVIRHYDLTVLFAVHTHAHFDHISATRDIKEATGCAIHLHPGDRFLYDGLSFQAQMFGLQARPPLPVDHDLVHEGQIAFGKQTAEVIHTPGHTPGSVCFSLKTDSDPLLLAGDTLFRRGIGRTDLPGGDGPQILRSIRERLYQLSPETRVIPGHGPGTTIFEEQRKNPFVTLN